MLTVQVDDAAPRAYDLAALGEQIVVIQQQDGRALDAAAGPLALRALGDLRPGPRHVRNLCALRVRRAG